MFEYGSIIHYLLVSFKRFWSDFKGADHFVTLPTRVWAEHLNVTSLWSLSVLKQHGPNLLISLGNHCTKNNIPLSMSCVFIIWWAIILFCGLPGGWYILFVFIMCCLVCMGHPLGVFCVSGYHDIMTSLLVHCVLLIVKTL